MLLPKEESYGEPRLAQLGQSQNTKAAQWLAPVPNKRSQMVQTAPYSGSLSPITATDNVTHQNSVPFLREKKTVSEKQSFVQQS